MPNNPDIWIITPQLAFGKRLAAVFYEAGYMQVHLEKSVPHRVDFSLGSTVILYQKQQIAAWMQKAAAWIQKTGCQIIILLDPDKYALYLDQAREAGILLMLMPAAPQRLLEATMPLQPVLPHTAHDSV